MKFTGLKRDTLNLKPTPVEVVFGTEFEAEADDEEVKRALVAGSIKVQGPTKQNKKKEVTADG